MPENHILAIEAIPKRLIYPSNEVRALLGDMSIPTFRRLTRSGALESVKRGSRVYVEHEVLMAYIKDLPSAATSSDKAA